MTTTPALRPSDRVLGPLRAEDLLFITQEVNRCLADPKRVPDLPDDPDLIHAFHILIHPRYDGVWPDAEDCPDCVDSQR